MATAVLAVLLLARAVDVTPFPAGRLAAFDLMQRLEPHSGDDRQVVIIDIDEASLARFGQWPWPRTRLAELTERLGSLGARVIGFDIVLAEPDRLSPTRLAEGLHTLDPGIRQQLRGLPDHDRRFAEAIEGARVVLGGVAAPTASGADERPWQVGRVGVLGRDTINYVPEVPGVLWPIPLLERAASGTGLLTVQPDRDGAVRRMPMMFRDGARLYPSFAAETLRVALTADQIVVVGRDAAGIEGIVIGPLRLAVDRNGFLLMRHARSGSAFYVSAAEVMTGAAARSQIADRVALVGSTAAGLGDIWATPVQSSVPGIEILAQAIDNALSASALERPPSATAQELALAAIVGLLLIIVLPRRTVRLKIAIFGTTVVVVLAIAWTQFTVAHTLFDPVFPIASATAVFGCLAYTGFRQEERRRRAREAALHRFDAFMRRVSQNLFDGLLTTDRHGLIRSANVAAAAIFGALPEVLVGKPVDRFLQLGERERRGASRSPHRLMDLAARGKPWETKGRRQDGTMVDLEVAVTSTDQNDAPVHILVVRDISARRQAEALAGQLRSRLLDAIENISDGFALFDRVGNLVLSNAPFRTLWADLETVVMPRPAPPGGGSSAADGEATPGALSGGMPAGPPFGSFEHLTGDGRWCRIDRRPTSEGGVVAIVSDIGPMKLRERELVDAKTRADMANQAKSDFLANMSHDLRTPLNAIIGFSEMMTTRVFGQVGNHRYEDYVAKIHESALHLGEIISRILDLSRVESGVLQLEEQTIDLAATIEACVGILSVETKKQGLEMSHRTDPTVRLLSADPMCIKDILINLLSNAIKFTPPGGRVSVSADPAEDGGVVLSVSDTGIGIATDHIERVMDRFVRVEDAYTRKFSGVGLGLSLVKSLVELHGGRLHLQSEPGVGTTAMVFFPASRRRSQPDWPAAPQSGPAAMSGGGSAAIH